MGEDDEAEANVEDLDVGPGEAASHQRSKRNLPPVVQSAVTRCRDRCVRSKLEGAELEAERRRPSERAVQVVVGPEPPTAAAAPAALPPVSSCDTIS